MVVVIFASFFTLLILAVPIAMAMGFSTILPALIDPSFSGNLEFVVRSMIKGVDTTSILAIPLFMLSGAIMATGGLSRKLFDVFAVFIGKIKGGMPCAVVVTCLFYGAISGSGPATCAAVGTMCIPFLYSLGYDKVWSAALVATAGGLGVIIPPSIPFISYGLVTDTSVGDMFTAGILPGCLIALCLMAYVQYHCRVKGEDREKIESHYSELRSRGVLTVIKDGFWALLTPVIILGGIYSGDRNADGSGLRLRILRHPGMPVYLQDGESKGSARFLPGRCQDVCSAWHDAGASTGIYESAGSVKCSADDCSFPVGEYYQQGAVPVRIEPGNVLAWHGAGCWSCDHDFCTDAAAVCQNDGD